MFIAAVRNRLLCFVRSIVAALKVHTKFELELHISEPEGEINYTCQDHRPIFTTPVFSSKEPCILTIYQRISESLRDVNNSRLPYLSIAIIFHSSLLLLLLFVLFLFCFVFFLFFVVSSHIPFSLYVLTIRSCLLCCSLLVVPSKRYCYVGIICYFIIL